VEERKGRGDARGRREGGIEKREKKSAWNKDDRQGSRRRGWGVRRGVRQVGGRRKEGGGGGEREGGLEGKNSREGRAEEGAPGRVKKMERKG